MLSYRILAILLGALSFCNAHHIITNIYVNGVDQGDGVCIRIPPSTGPVVDVRSDDMACNVGGWRPLDKFASIGAGDNVSFKWKTWPDGSQEVPIDISHEGPCAVYLKKVDSFSDQAAGTGWFKIWQLGYENGNFCTETLRQNGGMMNFKIPEDLAGGRYLIRGEHLALQQAETEGGAQWYIGCAQAVIYSTGGSATPSGVAIPGYVKSTDPGVLFDYWKNMHPTSYTIPGPTPYVATNAGGGKRILVNYPTKYSECPISNADWCSSSPSSFYDENSCWASAGESWNRLKICYDSAPQTGHAGCSKYEIICNGYQAYCRTCASAGKCVGTFPGQPAKTRREARIVHRHRLLPPLEKRALFEATGIVASSDEDKLASASKLCEEIAAKCSENGIGGLCKVVGAACRGALHPAIIGQFPENNGKKWQALWLYQIACENEDFEKDECKKKFSKAIWGFE